MNYQLKLLCKHSHEGSFETRVGRERQLGAIVNQLHGLGFRQLKATSLKQKHVQTLVELWLKQKLSPCTIKNRKDVDGVSNATVNRALEIVRRILHLARDARGWLESFPRIRMLSEPRRRERFLTRQEADRVEPTFF